MEITYHHTPHNTDSKRLASKPDALTEITRLLKAMARQHVKEHLPVMDIAEGDSVSEKAKLVCMFVNASIIQMATTDKIYSKS